MKRLLILPVLLLLGQAAPPAPAPMRGPPDPYAAKKRVLFIADTSTGMEVAHMGVSHAFATVERVGREQGAYVAFVRTDTDVITRGEIWGKGDYAKGGPKQARRRNLDYFDAVVFYTNGETNLSDAQKADLLAWVKEGHGFVGIHTATATAYKWPEYGEMIGGYFDNHPWNVAPAKIIVERPDHPAMKALKSGMTITDEHYQMRAEPYSRARVDVLARLDPASVDLTNPSVHRADHDFPVAWIKSYGAGRVFYSGLGHTDAAWDDPRVQTMFAEGIKWALKLTPGEPQPHPVPVK